LDLSNLADNKANIMISINGIMISVVIASISPKIDSNPWLLVPTGVLLLGCAISMVYAILAARPRVTHRRVSLEDVESNRSNILFFGNFVGMPEEEFVSGLRSLLENTDRLYTNMMRDIYGLGQVLQRKYTLLRTSYTAFMVALILSVLLFLGVYMGVVGEVGAVGTGSVVP
ncbi:MAG: phosphohydrolase, partial [Gemmatimonadetes bacterium]|nr:phosphohydrolase [Gemmatimonadota bacterium]